MDNNLIINKFVVDVNKVVVCANKMGSVSEFFKSYFDMF